MATPRSPLPPDVETSGAVGRTSADPPSPWSALLRDNLNADEVAGFLSNAIARKEAALMGSQASGSPARRQSAGTGSMPPPIPPMSASSAATRVSDAAIRQAMHRVPPTSAARVRDRRNISVALSEASGNPAFDSMLSRDSSRPGSPELDAAATTGRAPVPASPKPSGAAAPATPAEWRGYIIKAQQSESSAREEARKLQAQLERTSSRHVDELSESQRRQEELKSQVEVRQFALQHATEARDAAIARAEAADRELAAELARHTEVLNSAQDEARRQAALAGDAQAALEIALEEGRRHAERAAQQERRATDAERTCGTLRLAVESLGVAKQQVEAARDAVGEELELERRRGGVERALIRSYAIETEQEVPRILAHAAREAREAEAVEASLTEQLSNAEASAERQRLASERTIAQLRGHVAELEEAVLEQQREYERERSEAAEAHAAALAEREAARDAAAAKCELLTQQLSALAEAARTIKAERGAALASLQHTAARLEETEGALAAAREAEGAAAAREAAALADMEGVAGEVATLSEQLAWLEACTRDASDAARPMLAAPDSVPLLDADAAFREERSRWAAGTAELHATVTQLCDGLAWLSSELQGQLSASPAAASAAAPAAELHEDLAAQIRTAASNLPSAFAPIQTFERARVALVEAVRAQATLGVQSVAHLISCAADAEAVATLQAKQLKAQAAAASAALKTERSVAVAALSAELGLVETEHNAAESLAWTHAGGLAVQAGEVAELEAALHGVSMGRAAAEARAAGLGASLTQAREELAEARQELRGASAELQASAEREAALERALQLTGLEGQMEKKELLEAVQQAELTGAERVRAAAVAMARANDERDGASLESIILRGELADLERLLDEASAEGAAAAAARDEAAAAHAEAHEAHEAASRRGDELEASLGEASRSLSESRDEVGRQAAELRRAAEEAVEWAAKLRAVEAMSEAEARNAAGRQSALLGSMSELDEALKRVAAQLTRSQGEAAVLAGELALEEEARPELDELRSRRAEEEAARREREGARAAQQAVQQAALQRELRALQRQLVYPSLPALALSGGDAFGGGDASSEALWAGLLADTSTAPMRPPPALSYMNLDDPSDAASELAGAVATLRASVDAASAPVTGGGAGGGGAAAAVAATPLTSRIAAIGAR